MCFLAKERTKLESESPSESLNDMCYFGKINGSAYQSDNPGGYYENVRKGGNRHRWFKRNR